MFWVSGPPLCVTVTTAISMWEGSTERQAQGFKDTLLRLPFFGRIIPFHNTLDCKTIERPDIVRSTKFTGLSPLVYSTAREIGSFIEVYTKVMQTLVVSPTLTSFHVFKQTVPLKFQKCDPDTTLIELCFISQYKEMVRNSFRPRQKRDFYLVVNKSRGTLKQETLNLAPKSFIQTWS